MSNSDERFWQVQAVFSCGEHEGAGFAYTIGLAKRGLHELHMYDRPTHGDDPGSDFNLSSSDLGHILNDLADDWVAGSLWVGDTRELTVDDGLTTLVVTFGEPVDANSVEAYGARPSLVVPLAWSLHRPPRGAKVEIMDDPRVAYEREIRALASHCDPRVAVSGARMPGEVIDFDVDGPYGPLSALVEANARAVAGVVNVDVLIGNVLAAGAVVSPGALSGRMTTLSRLSGRDEQLEQVHLLAHRVVDRLAKRRVWRNQVSAVAGSTGLRVKRAGACLEDAVGAAVMCMLMGVALDDVLPDDMALAAQGSWRATLSATGSDPGQRWRCSAPAEHAIRCALAELDGFELRHVIRSMIGPIAELLGPDLVRVQGLALTTAVAPPAVTDLVLTRHRANVSSPLAVQQLSLFAQLMATVIDGAFDLDDDRAGQLEAIIGWPVDGSWWSAA